MYCVQLSTQFFRCFLFLISIECERTATYKYIAKTKERDNVKHRKGFLDSS